MMQGTVPKMPKKGVEIMNYAWKLFSDDLEKKTIWYDSRDPEKEIQKEKFNHFHYKTQLKQTGKLS